MNERIHPQRSRLPYVFLGLSVVLALLALAIWIIKPGVNPPPEPVETTTPVIPATPEPANHGDPVSDQDVAATPLEVLGQGLVAANPADLVTRLANALQSGDFNTIAALIGSDNLDPATKALLDRLAAASPKLREANGLREVGELEQNRRARWVLELEEPIDGAGSVVVDLIRGDDGWKIDRITMPEAGIDVEGLNTLDSLGVADAFLQNVLQQNFQSARRFVDPGKVTDATIAGLCILFEEGDYQLRASRPLRALFVRGDTASYLANVDASDGSQAAQFGISLRQSSENAPWLVTEINLDQLLADYAQRVAGGDVYYSPFVRDPEGGETIALYFEFDDDGINPRASRQLQIIASVLKSDPERKITLSGHTDALGTVGYNDELSARRARVVRDFLAASGVDASQIVTLAKGASQPRRPNVTETGEDDPDGRRANRRTEIYLDF